MYRRRCHRYGVAFFQASIEVNYWAGSCLGYQLLPGSLGYNSIKCDILPHPWFILILKVEYLFSDKTGTLTKNEMSFQRLAVGDGTFLLRDAMLHPLFDVQAKKMRDLRLPRFSGAGLPPTQMPTTVRILLIFLALCHTVRVEQDPDARQSLSMSLMDYMRKQSRLKNRMKERFRLMRLNKMTPPSKEWTYRRRESAILSAQEAVSAVNSGSEIDSGGDYEYQVRIFT